MFDNKRLIILLFSLIFLINYFLYGEFYYDKEGLYLYNGDYFMIDNHSVTDMDILQNIFYYNLYDNMQFDKEIILENYQKTFYNYTVKKYYETNIQYNNTAISLLEYQINGLNFPLNTDFENYRFSIQKWINKNNGFYFDFKYFNKSLVDKDILNGFFIYNIKKNNNNIKFLWNKYKVDKPKIDYEGLKMQYTYDANKYITFKLNIDDKNKYLNIKNSEYAGKISIISNFMNTEGQTGFGYLKTDSLENFFSNISINNKYFEFNLQNYFKAFNNFNKRDLISFSFCLKNQYKNLNSLIYYSKFGALPIDNNLLFKEIGGKIFMNNTKLKINIAGCKRIIDNKSDTLMQNLYYNFKEKIDKYYSLNISAEHNVDKFTNNLNIFYNSEKSNIFPDYGLQLINSYNEKYFENKLNVKISIKHTLANYSDEKIKYNFDLMSEFKVKNFLINLDLLNILNHKYYLSEKKEVSAYLKFLIKWNFYD